MKNDDRVLERQRRPILQPIFLGRGLKPHSGSASNSALGTQRIFGATDDCSVKTRDICPTRDFDNQKFLTLSQDREFGLAFGLAQTKET